jgi:crossover junction endodeoxyribonuclease RuvC
MLILGIDPGSTATGYGVVEGTRAGLRHVAHGIVRPKAGDPLASRLAHIHAEVLAVARAHAPELAVVERIFVAANPRSALVLGQARGVALAALAAAQVEVGEFAAREVKQAVVGNGNATKAQVQAMVMRLLALDVKPPTDAADALAIAICQAHSGRLSGLGVTPSRRRMSRRKLATLIVESRS